MGFCTSENYKDVELKMKLSAWICPYFTRQLVLVARRWWFMYSLIFHDGCVLYVPWLIKTSQVVISHGTKKVTGVSTWPHNHNFFKVKLYTQHYSQKTGDNNSKLTISFSFFDEKGTYIWKIYFYNKWKNVLYIKKLYIYIYNQSKVGSPHRVELHPITHRDLTHNHLICPSHGRLY